VQEFLLKEFLISALKLFSYQDLSVTHLPRPREKPGDKKNRHSNAQLRREIQAKPRGVESCTSHTSWVCFSSLGEKFFKPKLLAVWRQ